MFDKNADPNLFTHNSQMSALHIAACRMYPAIIELLLMNKRTKIDILSPLHGTPLHLACLVGSVKIVQQLLLNGACINVVNSKNRLPRDLTTNQRILYLIDKNEKRLETSFHTNGNDLDEMSFSTDGLTSQSFSKDIVENNS